MSIHPRTPEAAGVKVVRPGAGDAGSLGPGLGVVFKIDGPDTGGALSIVEHPFEVGGSVEPHLHRLEDEISIVLDGEIGFRSENQEVVLGAGGYIVKPHGEVHAMWNAGATPARMIEVITPAGFEGLFREYATLAAAAGPSAAQVAELAARYGLPPVEPDWWPDVVARYGLGDR